TTSATQDAWVVLLLARLVGRTRRDARALDVGGARRALGRREERRPDETTNGAVPRADQTAGLRDREARGLRDGRSGLGVDAGREIIGGELDAGCEAGEEVDRAERDRRFDVAPHASPPHPRLPPARHRAPRYP